MKATVKALHAIWFTQAKTCHSKQHHGVLCMTCPFQTRALASMTLAYSQLANTQQTRPTLSVQRPKLIKQRPPKFGTCAHAVAPSCNNTAEHSCYCATHFPWLALTSSVLCRVRWYTTACCLWHTSMQASCGNMHLNRVAHPVLMPERVSILPNSMQLIFATLGLPCIQESHTRSATETC